MLAHPSITAVELATAKQQLKDSVAQALNISESTDSAPNPALLDAPDVMSLLDSIIANGNKFEKALARLIKPFLKDTQLVIVNETTDVPAVYAAEFSGALGLYVSATNTIYLNAQTGVNNTVALHEALHAATLDALVAAILTPNAVSPKLRGIVQEIKQLMGAAANKYDTDKAAGRTTAALDKLAGESISVFTDIREFVSYGLTQPELQEFLNGVDATLTWKLGTLRNGLSKFLDLVRQIFNIQDKDYSAFIALTDLTEKLLIESALYERIPSDQIATAKDAGRKATRIAQKVAESDSRNLEAAIEQQSRAAQNGKKAAQITANSSLLTSPDVTKFIIGMMGTNTILKQKGEEIKNLYAMNEVVRKITTYKQKFLKNVAKESKRWGKFNYKYKEGAIILADVMHFATLHQLDPSLHKDMAAALANDKKLNDLRANFQQISTNPTSSQGSINSAKGQVTARENAIKEVYEGATINLQEIEDEIKALKADPANAGKTDAEIKALVQTPPILVGGWNRLQEKENGGQEGVRLYKMAHKTYKDNLAEFQALTLQEVKNRQLKAESEKDVLEKLERMFSEAKKIEVYFPLMRYGDFYVAIKAAKAGQDGPSSRIFRTFETQGERDNYVNQTVERYYGSIENALPTLVKEGIIERGNTLDSTKKAVRDNLATDGLLKDIFDTLDATTGQTQADLDVDALKDSVYQMYIQALPSADLRKGFVHRKGIAGFSNEVLRNYVTSQMRRSSQLARLKYSGDLQRAKESAYAELKGTMNQEQNEVWVNAFAERTASVLNPPVPGSLNAIQSVGSLAVFFYMLSTPASAFVNATQLHIVGLSLLSMKFGSTKARLMAARYTATLFNKFGLETGEPSMRTSQYFAEHSDKEFMEQAYDYADNLDAFNQTYAADLTQRGKNSIAEAVRNDRTGKEKVGRYLKKTLSGFLDLSSALFHHSGV